LQEKRRENSRNPESLSINTLIKCKKQAKNEDPEQKSNSIIDKAKRSKTRKTYSSFTSSLILEEDWLRSDSVKVKGNKLSQKKLIESKTKCTK
jgi:hypothetical protein